MTLVYFNEPLETFTQALDGIKVEELEYHWEDLEASYRLTWEDDKGDKTLGVELLVFKDGKIHVDRGHTVCCNAQSQLSDVLESKGVSATYWE